jgi:hypothetical protein
MKYQKGQGDLGQIIFIIILLVVGLSAYTFIKSAADLLHLDWSSAASLVIGLALIVALNLYVIFRANDWTRLVLPASFPLSLVAWFRPLEYWADSGMPSFSSYSAISLAWYGTWWGLLLIFVVLCGVGYIVHQWLDDRY